MVKHTYEVTIKKNFTCPKGQTVADLIAQKSAKIHTVIGAEPENGKYSLYLDSVDKTNKYGFIESVTELDEDDIQELAKNGGYEIILESVNGNEITGKLNVLIDEGSVVQVSDDTLLGELEQVVEDKIKEGALSKEAAKWCRTYMDENHVGTDLQIRVFKSRRNTGVELPVPEVKWVDPYLDEELKGKMETVVSKILRATVTGYGVLLQGPKATGKDTCLKCIYYLLGEEYCVDVLGSNTTFIDLFSTKSTDNSASEELAKFDKEKLVQYELYKLKRQLQTESFMAMHPHPSDSDIAIFMDSLNSEEDLEILKEKARYDALCAESTSIKIINDPSKPLEMIANGGCWCLDEMNMASANTLAGLNPLLDCVGHINIPGRGMIKVHPHFHLFATQNENYAGCQTQNDATKSRLEIVDFKQPKSVKKQLKAAVSSKLEADGFPNAKIDSKVLTEADKFYCQLMKAVNKGDISDTCLNIRGLVRAIVKHMEAASGTSPLKGNIMTSVVNGCDAEERPAIQQMLELCVTL